jgi:sperm-associated antigen 16 protein
MAADTFLLEQHMLPAESDDEFGYEEVGEEFMSVSDSDDEAADLSALARRAQPTQPSRPDPQQQQPPSQLQQTSSGRSSNTKPQQHKQQPSKQHQQQQHQQQQQQQSSQPPHRHPQQQHPSGKHRIEAPEDYVRNFLAQHGLQRSLECFHTEWYELRARGVLLPAESQPVDDLLARNLLLQESARRAEADSARFREDARSARATHDKLRKERDFHRMHHQRVVQEKALLMAEIKRLEKQLQAVEPELAHLRTRTEAAQREKHLARLERDRIATQAGIPVTADIIPSQLLSSTAASDARSRHAAMTRRELLAAQQEDRLRATRHPKDVEWPPAESAVIPDSILTAQLAREPVQLTGFRCAHGWTAHDADASAIAVHPTKQIIATGGDDGSWKMWSLPGGELVLAGQNAHKQWVADCKFHPTAQRLATASGDGTVKIWDYSKGHCVSTFAEHAKGVWSTSFHEQGDLLCSSSLDHTAKVWDLQSERCRVTLRGHSDSVNACAFRPYSALVYTGSADRVVAAWDPRIGQIVHRFVGHTHAVNDVRCTSIQGDQLVSCDAGGVVRVWDTRNQHAVLTVSTGSEPLNRVVVDPSGSVVAACCDDGSIFAFDTVQLAGRATAAREDIGCLAGHSAAVLGLAMDARGEFMASVAADGKVRIWS